MSRARSQGWVKDPIARPFPRIYVGDGHRLTSQFIEEMDITHVINCADASACRDSLPDEKYACLNAIDDIRANIFEWYPQFKQTMDKFLRDPTCKNVYVHCQCGINRSAFLASAYIIKTFRVSFEQCVLNIVNERPCVMTNTSFQKQLIVFAKKSD
jgi:protein-tyrosine phosphatase